jgi:putative endonuclease
MCRWVILCRQRHGRRFDAADCAAGYTSLRRPVELVWSEYFDRITDAIAAERQIKGWGRAKKQALMEGDWDSIRRLARRRAGKPKPDPSS